MRAIIYIFLFLMPLCSMGQLSAVKQRTIDSMVNAALCDKAFPGASVVVGNRNGVLYAKDYGYLDYTSGKAVTPATLYDIASCTKVLSTTFVAMRLYDRGLLKFSDKLGELTRFKNSKLSSLTVGELLTHTSGIGYKPVYPEVVKNSNTDKPLMKSSKDSDYPYNVDRGMYMARDVVIKTELFESIDAVDSVLYELAEKAYNPSKRGRYNYTDANFYLLKLIVEYISGKTLDCLTGELLAEIDCLNTGYNPLNWTCADNIAPTEYDYLLRRGQLCGTPHDEVAALCNGVGGNAGLFSTSEDIAKFCQMILDKGSYCGESVIKPSTVELFTSSPAKSNGVYRGYGFDKRSSGSLSGEWCCGHTGYTGTIFWIDMKKGMYMVFLSNSVHPSRINNKLQTSQLRVKIWNTVIGS